MVEAAQEGGRRIVEGFFVEPCHWLHEPFARAREGQCHAQAAEEIEVANVPREGAVFCSSSSSPGGPLFAGIVQFIRWRAKAITRPQLAKQRTARDGRRESRAMFVDIHLRTAPFGWARALLKVVTDAEAPAAA